MLKFTNSKQQELFDELLIAHYNSVFRNNASSQAVELASIASGNLVSAVQAALATLGGLHAPLDRSIQFLSQPDPITVADMHLTRGGRIPGWGNSFVDGKDPIWEKVEFLLCELYPDLMDKVAGVTRIFHEKGKSIYPNPSTYTAASVLVLGIKPELAAGVFIMGRLPGWMELAGKVL